MDGEIKEMMGRYDVEAEGTKEIFEISVTVGGRTSDCAFCKSFNGSSR